MDLQKYFELYTAAWKFFKKYASAKRSADLREQAWKELNDLYRRFNGTTDDFADQILVATYDELCRRVLDPQEAVLAGGVA